MRIYVTGLAATAAFLAYSKSSSEVSAFSTTVAAHSPSATVTDTDDTVAKRRLRTFGVTDGEERVNLAGQIMEVGVKSSNAVGKDGAIKLFGQVIEANAKRPDAAAKDKIMLFGQRIAKTGAKRSGAKRSGAVASQGIRPFKRQITKTGAKSPDDVVKEEMTLFWKQVMETGAKSPDDVVREGCRLFWKQITKPGAKRSGAIAAKNVEEGTFGTLSIGQRMAFAIFVYESRSKPEPSKEVLDALTKAFGSENVDKVRGKVGLKRVQEATTSTARRG
uniref:Uncharacterized protein n=1 Tax=Peronospora matthiolae TaxID=2874970 RepID=A0AAV1UQS0_9STRA